jgi:hypothetical protein
MTDKKVAKVANIFCCDICDYYTSKKFNLSKHLTTHKQEILTNTDKNTDNLVAKVAKFNCECGKIYKHRQSLFTHRKKCKINFKHSINLQDKNELLDYLLSENKEFKEMLKEQNNFIIQNIKLNSNTNNLLNSNINSNNKSFNLNLFLNETCKNAMNIMDFVDSIKLQISDLEKVGELGYVEGISKIIINNLKSLDVTERPVHCSDMKREVLYVKDDDKWEKEETENPKIKRAIKCIANKNISLIPEWKQKYPDCTNSNSKKSDIINKIIIESMETDKEKTDKIIKKIVKEVGIYKETHNE